MLNICIPLFLYIIKVIYYKPEILIFKNLNLHVFVINLIYFICFILSYINFLKDGNLITKVSNGHLRWPWIKYSFPFFYIILLAINIFYLYDFKYGLLLFTVTYIFLSLGYKIFRYNAGELWCLFGSFIPFIVFLLQKKLSKSYEKI